MREIKFRGVRIDNAEWVYGFYSVVNINHGIWARIKSEFPEWYQVHPESVGQFTGLKDKNGKDIYEGDIVAVFDTNNNYYNEEPDSYLESRLNREVKWHKDGGFTLEYDYGDYDITLLGWAVEHHELQLEIIGNIHQNPELINHLH